MSSAAPHNCVNHLRCRSQPLIDEYEKALDECGENHDDIDQDIATAHEKLDKASNEIEVAKVEKKIARLKRREGNVAGQS